MLFKKINKALVKFMAISGFFPCVCDAHNTAIYIYLIFREARHLPAPQQTFLSKQRTDIT